jgi:hypothetical protein
MKQPEFGATQFVRGMAWHDIGKPFALGTHRHAPLGYWLLCLAGYPGEGLVALAHGGRQDILARYFQSGGTHLPGVLALCNLLDRLSASTYSLQSRGKGLEAEYHSFQNPFSRLPVAMPGWEGSPAISFRELTQSFEPALWADVRGRLPQAWQDALTADAKRAVEDAKQPLPEPAPLPAGADALEVFMRYMAHYPERTYPSVNDTSLKQHGRLSGILAFVVYRNLEKAKAELFEQRIVSTNGKVNYPQSGSDVEKTVRRNSGGHLVRIAFEGHHDLFENAIRVDDLHGAQELTRLTKAAFKQALAEVLTVPVLAELLTISESQFDLIYLLPQAVESPSAVIHQAHQAAIGQVVAQVAERLAQDFPQIHRRDTLQQLRQQLDDIGYGVRIAPIQSPQEVDFGEFSAKYGGELLRAYREVQDDGAFPPASLPDGANWREKVKHLKPDETCEVCGNYPVLAPPSDLDDADKSGWELHRDYAAHFFRGERERICLSCVARRTLAHGQIAKRMDHLVHPMWKQAESRPGLWQCAPPEEGPVLPPLLAAAVHLDPAKIELADAIAFYIRYRLKGGRVDRSELDIFPTTTYAADANGNVVLLSLQPSQAVMFDTYPYDEAIRLTPEQGAGELILDARLWQDTFVEYYKKIQGGKETARLADPIRQVQPHLARVMERIQHVQRFYDDLYRRLADTAPRLRVLPLDTDYPTLRLLVPADELDEALRRLEACVTETLFSARVGKEDHAALHGLLSRLVPDLLHGTIILFKHKYPLYLALEAERDLFGQLAAGDERVAQAERPSRSAWYGLRLAFSDLRGTLSQVGPKLAEVTYADLAPVLDLARELDRRTVAGRAAVIDRAPVGDEETRRVLVELADALTVIRANKLHKDRAAQELLADDGAKFAPVLFLKTATRE